jgi:hypothetical protein
MTAAPTDSEKPREKLIAEALPYIAQIQLDDEGKHGSPQTSTVPPTAPESSNRENSQNQVLFPATDTKDQEPLSQAKSRISEQTKRKRHKPSKAPKNFYGSKNANGLQALDLNEGDLLMKTYNGTESFKRLATRRHQENLSMTIRPTSNAHCNINDMGDMTLTNKDYQVNAMLNSTYDNLLSFKGGKELKE